jgi:hypothetical protein
MHACCAVLQIMASTLQVTPMYEWRDCFKQKVSVHSSSANKAVYICAMLFAPLKACVFLQAGGTLEMHLITCQACESCSLAIQ